VWHAAAWCVVALLGDVGAVAAQTVVLDGPAGPTLPSLTPSLTVRASGFPLARPLRITILIGTSPDFTSGVAVDTTFLSADTVVAVQITRPLPSDAQVFWKARIFTPAGVTVESPVVGPRGVPPWLTLVYPNSQAGDIVDVRQPLFVWKSARVAPVLGAWSYDVDIFAQQRIEQTVSGLPDTTWRPISDLQSNTSYRWSVRATLKNGTTVSANSAATFIVKDQPFPSRTLIYQSFPNPFPSPTAFSACIWFDVAQPGARVSLDVTDLRGNLVRTLIPGVDGLRDFPPGQYGRGAPGAGSSCDNRFVWDGTGSDGRTVAPGVYLLRFQAGRQLPTFTRMLFLGR
jgi:hypothetical protein